MTALRTIITGSCTAAVAMGLLCTPVAAQEYCARKPPPEGLVKRCHSKTITVPPNESVLRVQLLEWMMTCVVRSRAVELVYADEASASIDRIWELLRDRYTPLPTVSDLKFVTVVPQYQPLTFTSEGRTCYGVKSVTFDLRGSRGEVDMGPANLPSYSEMVKEAAAAAARALERSGQTNAPGYARILGVLEGMAKAGERFDDTYFPVAPFTQSNMNYAACFKDTQWNCLPPAEAVQACEHHLGREIITAHFVDRLSPEAMAEFVLGRGTEILRGVDYMDSAKNADNRALFCPRALVETIMPKVQELARKHGKAGLYGYY